jgi:hypothetical protein
VLRFEACVGCGYCCLTAMCAVGYLVYSAGKEVDVPERCPYLLWNKEDGRYWCGLTEVHEKFKSLIHAGEGCCSTLNSWRKDVKYRG